MGVFIFFDCCDKNLIVLSRQLLIPLNSSKDDNSFVIIFLFLKFEIFVLFLLPTVKKIVYILLERMLIFPSVLCSPRASPSGYKLHLSFHFFDSCDKNLMGVFIFFDCCDKNLIVLSRQLLIPLNSSKDDNSFVIIFLFLKFEIFVLFLLPTVKKIVYILLERMLIFLPQYIIYYFCSTLSESENFLLC
jgi:hypothetical protein